MAPISHYQDSHAIISRARFDKKIGKKIKREVLDASFMDQNHMTAAQEMPPNTITPCAACKFLRRRCMQECPFLPYFPPHEPHKFAYVHRVFGASNVSKMLMEVPESQRADTASSLVHEATMRLKDPVYGSVGAISVLQHQVQSLEAELDSLRAELIKYKCREARRIAPLFPPSTEPNPITYSLDAHPSMQAYGSAGASTDHASQNISYFC